jgi:hypothetical protein
MALAAAVESKAVEIAEHYMLAHLAVAREWT